MKQKQEDGIRLIFEAEDGFCAEKITVYKGPLEKGEAFEAAEVKGSLSEAGSSGKALSESFGMKAALSEISAAKESFPQGTGAEEFLAEAKASEVFLTEAAAGSVYSYKLDSEGCYVYTGVVAFTAEDAANGVKIIPYRMEKRRESGFEAVFVSRWTEEVENGCFNLEHLKGFDKRVPDTPAFSKDKAAHQFTSAEEALAFLKKICASYSGVYLYELKGQGGCPAVIFTKEHLDDAGTLDEALKKLAADGRLKALYQAQLHGNEPAAGEGALAAVQKLAEIYDGGLYSRSSARKKNCGKTAGAGKSSCDMTEFGGVLAEAMDILIIPFANENGSREFSRWETVCGGENCVKEASAERNRASEIGVSGSDGEKLDLNRDALLLRSEVTRAIHCIFCVLMPEIFIDAHEFSGRKRGSDGEKLDLNRDALLLRSEVTRAIHCIFCVLMPEIFIDAHEFSGRKRQVHEENGHYILDSLDDIQITCVDHLNRDRRIFELENRIMLDTIDSLSEKGFRSFFFPGSFSQNTSCGYARLMYALTFLVESNGIRRGKIHYGRRVLSQREAVLAILFQAAAEADTIREQVAAARKDFVKRGGVFDEEDIFVLEQKTDESRGVERPRKSFDFAGNPIDADRRVFICNRGEAVRGRIRPAAYILPKDCPGAEKAAEILSANGAVYEELEAGESVCVEQYLYNGEKIVRSCAENRTFEAGAYVFSLQQMAANVISASLEPDLGDVTERNGSFLQAGILHRDGDVCPVYRLVFQENPAGKKDAGGRPAVKGMPGRLNEKMI